MTPRFNPEAWVRMQDAPEVSELFEQRHKAHGKTLSAFDARAKLLGMEALAHPTAPSWMNAAQKTPAGDPALARLKGLGGGVAAGSALHEGKAAQTEALIDNDGHIHLGVLGRWLAFKPEDAGRRVKLKAGRSGLELELEGGAKRKVPAEWLRAPNGGEGDGVSVVPAPRIQGGVEIQTCDPMILWPMHVHPVARLTNPDVPRFEAPLSRALEEMREVDAPMHGELLRHLKIIVPLENPKNMGSVSSTYRELPGLVCLSHSDDTLLQQETLIHEYCHSKINLLTEQDPLLLPGQRAAVFYSPWRDDPRPLRGVLLGAHAFLNVGLHLLHSVQARPETAQDSEWVMRSIVRRTLQVETALRVTAAYGRLTALGSQMVTEMFRHLSILQHAVESFPAETVREASEANEAHRAKHALGRTFMHDMKRKAQA